MIHMSNSVNRMAEQQGKPQMRALFETEAYVSYAGRPFGCGSLNVDSVLGWQLAFVTGCGTDHKTEYIDADNHHLHLNTTLLSRTVHLLTSCARYADDARVAFARTRGVGCKHGTRACCGVAS
jgi:hypothetical protein